jgi:hypothetical protein
MWHLSLDTLYLQGVIGLVVEAKTTLSANVKVVKQFDTIEDTVELREQLVARESAGVIVDLYGANPKLVPKVNKIELVESNGNILDSIYLDQYKDESKFYKSSFQIPNKSFKIRISGIDAYGYPFERFNPKLYLVSSYRVKAFLDSIEGDAFTIKFELENHDDIEKKYILEVEACDDFTMEPFYYQIDIQVEEDETKSEIIVLNKKEDKENLCSVKLTLTDQISKEHVTTKVVNMDRVEF